MLGNARSRRRWERGNWTGLDRATVRKCLPQPPTPRRVRHPTVCRALPAMGVPGAVLGILVSLLSSLLSALGMNLQAGQALIEAAATAAASPSSPRSAAWRRLSRSFSRFGDDHWLFGADGEEAPPDRGAEEPHDRAAGGVTPPDPATPPDAATEATPLLSHAAHLPAARPRRIPTVVEQSRALESAPLPPGTVLCKRLLGPWMWHAGLALYLVGTAGGGSLALCFLPPLVLAPLSSASLVFNIGFSRWILGTEIGAHDYVGTVLLLAGSALCGVFASQDNAVTSPATLPVLLSSPLFLAAFSAQAALSLAAFLPLVAWESLRPGGALSRHIWVPWLPPLEEQTGALAYAEEEEGWADAWADKGSGGEGAKGGRRREVWAGMAYAAVGGVVASLSLLLTKSGVDLAITSLLRPSPGDPPLPLSSLIPLLLALPLTLLVQLYALHRSLDLAPPLMSVPVFFAGYTLPQLPDQVVVNLAVLGRSGYEVGGAVCVGVGMGLVVGGVGVLARGGRVQ